MHLVIKNFAVAMTAVGLAAEAWAQEVDVSKLPAAAGAQVDFARDIQPIFEVSCLRCHGPEKPKSRFRLDNRESALKGGENGMAIVPGDSAKSPLIHFVAGLVEDMEMPPKGKGDALTPGQVGLLRAWIDQGAQWPEVAVQKLKFSFTPTAGWISVKGDERRFREHHWTREGWTGGVQEFQLEQQFNANDRFLLEGRAIGNNEDYALKFSLERGELGFIRGGAERFRTYYDDSGGYYPAFTPSIFELDRDLYTDRTKAWVDLGLRAPGWPEITLGYEYQLREGAQSTLHWGDVTQGGETRRIYPAFKDVNEQTHILKLDVAHEIAGVRLEDNFRAEFWDLTTRRTEVGQFNTLGPAPDTFLQLTDRQQHFQAANTFRLERQIRDWWFASGGYLYTHTDSHADLQFNNFTTTGAVPFGDYWSAQGIVLDQHSHVFNLSSLLGPWSGLTLSAGAQSEWQRQRGFGNVNIDFGAPGVFFIPQPATISANYDRAALEELVSLRFTSIPSTVLFAEARLQQESIGQFEQDIGGGQDFLRNTDASAELYDYSAGFTISPWQQTSLTAELRQRRKHSGYNHRVDQALAFPNAGYSAFIRERDVDLHEAKIRLSLRPVRWLKTQLTYQMIATDYSSVTDAEALTASPGGPIFAANHDTHIYTANTTFTPWRRFYFNGTFMYQDQRSRSASNNDPAVAPYEGNIYTVVSGATCVLDNRTDIHVAYSFSRAEFGQFNGATGLPLGIDYDLHSVLAGFTRRIRETMKAGLQYGYYRYREPAAGGANDYTAHGVFATFSKTWP
ncbi:MAG: c-type cytochrome domain-containing protein [Verrucomicrobiota bacterium]